MITVTKKKVFAAAALIFATGVSAVALPNSPAQAMSLHGPGTPAYAGSRILEAFDVVAEMPQVDAVRVPMATKGDLPIPLGCIGMQLDAQAECMDVAYEVPSEPSTVVETRVGNTSILTRMDVLRVSGLIGEEPKVGRINDAFQVVSEMPPVPEVRGPMATKGDLPVSLACVGLSNNAQAGCMDVAYKGFTEPSFVVATSFGNTTTLLRRDAMAVAEVFDKVFWQQGSVVSE